MQQCLTRRAHRRRGQGTGLPVIIFSLILVYSVSKLGAIMNKVGTFEKWTRKIVAGVFILTGIYYIGAMVL
ncbi:MAG: hypothetical protein ACLFO2_00770 [Candidatus Woesearchaeota archaeon]